jgi:hypothetical protein
MFPVVEDEELHARLRSAWRELPEIVVAALPERRVFLETRASERRRTDARAARKIGASTGAHVDLRDREHVVVGEDTDLRVS